MGKPERGATSEELYGDAAFGVRHWQRLYAIENERANGYQALAGQLADELRAAHDRINELENAE